MNQKCLNTIFVPVHPLNYNSNPPSFCQKHQKSLSYYNKYKPDDDPICVDCLLDETKADTDSNLYIPFSNLEQEYYYQKNAFFQIIEQANNMKKYDSHIANFKNLLTNFFSQFISKFLKETISDKSPQKKVEIQEKNNNCLNPKEIMNILNKVENEKYILDNKCADVFCQINKFQTILLNNHEKLAESFKNLLNNFFEESSQELSNQKESNKKNNIKDQSNKANDSPKNTPEYSTKTQFETKTRSDDKINQFSPGEELLINFEDKIKEIPNFSNNIHLNMEKDKIFEENIEFDIEEEKKSVNANEINNSFTELGLNEKDLGKIKVENELEWRKKKGDNKELAWRRKKNDDDNIYLDHKEKINQLIEQDKSKKVTANVSFIKSTKNIGFKNKSNLNKSLQKYQQHKYNFPKKKIEYKQYNQFEQKICKRCNSSFITTKNEEICQNCKCVSDEDEKINNRRLRNYSQKNGKFGFFQKNCIGQKKLHISSRIGNKKTFDKKGLTQFNRHFCNKALIHSNSNFLNHRNNNRINTLNPYDSNKRFFNSKYKTNRGKDNYDGKFGKKKNKVGRTDDFEVDLEGDEESLDNNKANDGEKSFFKTTDDIFRDDKECDKDSYDNKSDCSINKKGICENDKNDVDDDDNCDEKNDRYGDGDDGAGDNDFEADF